MISALRTAARQVFGVKQKPTEEQILRWRDQESIGREMEALVKTRGWAVVADALKLKLAALSDLEAVQDERDLQVRKARVQELRGVLELPQRLMEDGAKAGQALARAYEEDGGHGG